MQCAGSVGTERRFASRGMTVGADEANLRGATR